MSDLVRYEIRERSAILTLNRVDKRNALSRGLITAIGEAFDRAANDPQARSVILTGAGSVFCAGMDLAELQESLTADVSTTPIWDDALRLGKVYDRIYRLHKPTIAAVNGAAVAGGAGLVSVCDLAVSVPDAKFGYPEVRRGLVAAMVMTHLMRHVGERMSRYLLLTGELISAEEARMSGFLNAVVPADKLLEQALTWGRALTEGGPEALRGTKELLRTFSHQAMGVDEAAKASAAPRLTQECKQGLEAFFAKKAAPWAGA
jgi:methylglutaconyl-CoA hydratase